MTEELSAQQSPSTQQAQPTQQAHEPDTASTAATGHRRRGLRAFRPLTWVMLGFIKVWRAVISPLYGDVCKYHPSCSAYGLRAVDVHGSLKGGGLTIWRILRCNPWSAGGYDPVPGTPEAAEWTMEQANREALSDRGSAHPRSSNNPLSSPTNPLSSPTNTVGARASRTAQTEVTS